MKKKIFLHIGTHKTGTTSLQKFLYDHKNELKLMSFYFPKIGIHQYSQHKLAFSLQDKHPLKNQLKLWEELVDKIKKTECDNIIISSEEFSNIDNIDNIIYLKEVLKEFDIKIIVYLRRQSDLVESIYNQQTKDWKSPRKEPIEFFINNDKLNLLCKYLDYFTFLDKWSSVFGIKNIIIRAYKKNVIKDFLNIIDCNIKVENKVFFNINKSTSAKALETIRLYKHLNESIEVGKFIYEVANTVFPAEKFTTSLLTKEEKILIDQKFIHSNKKLFEIFSLEEEFFNLEYKCVKKEKLDRLDIMKLLVYIIKNVKSIK